MIIKVEKLTDVLLLREANSITTGKPSKMTLTQCYSALHSNARTQIFWIKMYDIPLSVASHLVRHTHSQPYQRSKRPDRDPDAIDLGRKTPTDLGMLLNAEEIINISKVRLCSKASAETRAVWKAVVDKIRGIDPDLANHCQPTCIFRGGICPEPNSCGFNKTELFNKQLENYKNNFEL